MFGASVKRLLITLALAVVLQFVGGVMLCCQRGCVNSINTTEKPCITTGRPIDLCLDEGYRILLIEVYLINILCWWFSVNVVWFAMTKIDWKKIKRVVTKKSGIV